MKLILSVATASSTIPHAWWVYSKYKSEMS